MKTCKVGPTTVSSVIKEFEGRNLIVVEPQRGIFAADTPEFASLATTRLRQVDVIYVGPPKDVRLWSHDETLSTLCEETTSRGFSLRLHRTDRGDAGLDQLRKLIADQHFEACIVFNELDLRELEPLDEAHVPYVNLFPSGLQLPPNSVITDANDVVNAQLGHLIALGHRKIGYLHNIYDHLLLSRDLFLRREAFFRVALDRGLPIKSAWVHAAGYTPETQSEGARAVLTQADRPTALVCYDDHLPAVYRVASELGLSIPRDLSIVGVNDEPKAQMVDPPATSISIPRREAAALALNMLEDVVNHPDGTVPTQYTDVKLVVRGSTGPAPAGTQN